MRIDGTDVKNFVVLIFLLFATYHLVFNRERDAAEIAKGQEFFFGAMFGDKLPKVVYYSLTLTAVGFITFTIKHVYTMIVYYFRM